MPLLIGFTLSRLLADPFFELVLAYNPNAFALSDKEKVEGAREVEIHEMRLRMDAAIGRAPPLIEEELQVESRPFATNCTGSWALCAAIQVVANKTWILVSRSRED